VQIWNTGDVGTRPTVVACPVLGSVAGVGLDPEARRGLVIMFVDRALVDAARMWEEPVRMLGRLGGPVPIALALFGWDGVFDVLWYAAGRVTAGGAVQLPPVDSVPALLAAAHTGDEAAGRAVFDRLQPDQSGTEPTDGLLRAQLVLLVGAAQAGPATRPTP
jgi:hypothetical protein